MLEPMSYPGGKGGDGVYQRIINLMPPHEVYIEPFLGGASVMRMKRPAGLNIGLDLDPEALEVASAAVDGALHRLIKGDGIDFLEGYPFNGRELVYCDPPYLMSTRSGKRLYEHEMDDLQHRRLLRAIRNLPCMVMISGYSSVLYARELRDWHAGSFPVMTRGGTERAEWLWYNFPPPVELHDYRYLGRDFRERERIKRQKARWVARIERMRPLQKQAMLAAIASISGSGEGRSTHTLHNKI